MNYDLTRCILPLLDIKTLVHTLYLNKKKRKKAYQIDDMQYEDCYKDNLFIIFLLIFVGKLSFFATVATAVLLQNHAKFNGSRRKLLPGRRAVVLHL